MKSRKCLYLIFIFTLTSCNYNKNKCIDNNTENTIRIKQNYCFENFEICEPDSSLFPILDSVAISIQNCLKLQHENLIYRISIFEEQNSLTHINIEALEQRKIYCHSIGKFFRYKSILFEVNVDNQYKHLFTNKGQKIKFKCQQDNSSMFDYNDYRQAYWNYVYSSGFKCIAY